MIEDTMQQFHTPSTASETAQQASTTTGEHAPVQAAQAMQEAARAAERARLRQGIMHVRIRHFYCALEEMFDPTLKGLPFVVGTGMGRPNEPGRVIDVSPAAMRLGIIPGMPLRRAHR